MYPVWGKGEAYTGIWRENLGKEPLGRPMRSWKNNIKMDLQEMGCGGMDWIQLAQERGRWRGLVNAVMNLRVPKMRGIS
jgi:hypothetical protein